MLNIARLFFQILVGFGAQIAVDSRLYLETLSIDICIKRRIYAVNKILRQLFYFLRT